MASVTAGLKLHHVSGRSNVGFVRDDLQSSRDTEEDPDVDHQTKAKRQ